MGFVSILLNFMKKYFHDIRSTTSNCHFRKLWNKISKQFIAILQLLSANTFGKSMSAIFSCLFKCIKEQKIFRNFKTVAHTFGITLFLHMIKAILSINILFIITSDKSRRIFFNIIVIIIISRYVINNYIFIDAIYSLAYWLTGDYHWVFLLFLKNICYLRYLLWMKTYRGTCVQIPKAFIVPVRTSRSKNSVIFSFHII